MQEVVYKNNNYSMGAVLLTGVIGIILGYFLGITTSNSSTAVAVRETGSEVGDVVAEVVSPDDSTTASTENSQLVSGNPNDVAFSIDVSTLSASQRTALRAAGVSGEEMFITKGMVACMEAEVGAERMMAIQNGDSQSITEGLALMGCYSAG